MPTLAPAVLADLTAAPTLAIDVSARTGRTVSGTLTAWVTGTTGRFVEHVAGVTEAGRLMVFYRSPFSDGWRVIDASSESGQHVGNGALTSWQVRDGEFTVEHVAAMSAKGELLVHYWSRRNGIWRAVNASDEAGTRLGDGGLTSWVTRSGVFTVEHVAAVGPDGGLRVFWWSPRAGRWQSVNASAEAGSTVRVQGLTSWVTRDGDVALEHVAATGANGHLLVFTWSRTVGHWRVVDATAESGRQISTSPTSWLTQSGEFTVEHVAGADTQGQLTVFWWSPRVSRWQAVNATGRSRGPAVTGTPSALPLKAGDGSGIETVVCRGAADALQQHWWTSALDWQVVDLTEVTAIGVAADPVVWHVPGSPVPERIGVCAGTGHLFVFESAGLERDEVTRLRQPAFTVQRLRNVRRKVLTILWDPHRPIAPRPDRSVVEAAVLGATDSARAYYIENSDGLYTIESAGVLGWFDSDREPGEYWPPGGAGRDSGREAIRKAAATFDFAAMDADGDGDVDPAELGILFILPGTRADGGGLNRIVGEDFTTTHTAQGISVDGKRIGWIAEVAIGVPPTHGIIAHELGHLLIGLGDMYFDKFFNPAEASQYSLMDQHGGGWHLDPFAKLKAGWLHPRVVHRTGHFDLPDVETNHVALALLRPHRNTLEYFLVENRWRGASFDKRLFGQGLAVWHIIEDPTIYDMFRPPHVTAAQWHDIGTGPGAWSRKAIRLVRPNQEPPIRDQFALWDGSNPATGYDLLSVDSDPTHTTLRWADGVPSGFALRSIGPPGPVVSLTVEVGAAGGTIVPHVRFLPRSNAANLVVQAGLVPVFGGPTGPGTPWVFSQSPAGGAVATPGSNVTMQLHTGPVP